jgi:3-phenylpropionate/cinnamic acid dioxygenase small subunit
MFEETIETSGISAEDRMLINETLVRYATGIDHKQWKLFRSCWTEDCYASYGELVFEGADAITDGMERIHNKITQSEHRLTNVDVLTWDGQVATTRSYTHAILINADEPSDSTFHIAGHYHDQLVRDGDRWKLDKRHWTTIWTDGNIGVMNFGEQGAKQVGAA